MTKSPNAIAEIIRCVNANYEGNGMQMEIERFAACFGTDDFIEGVTAFLEKRKADFKRMLFWNSRPLKSLSKVACKASFFVKARVNGLCSWTFEARLEIKPTAPFTLKRKEHRSRWKTLSLSVARVL